MTHWVITEYPPHDHWKEGLMYLDVIDTVSQYGPSTVKIAVPKKFIQGHEPYNKFTKVFISGKWVDVWRLSSNKPNSLYYERSIANLKLLNREPPYVEVYIPKTSLP